MRKPISLTRSLTVSLVDHESRLSGVMGTDNLFLSWEIVPSYSFGSELGWMKLTLNQKRMNTIANQILFNYIFGWGEVSNGEKIIYNIVHCDIQLLIHRNKVLKNYPCVFAENSLHHQKFNLSTLQDEKSSSYWNHFKINLTWKGRFLLWSCLEWQGCSAFFWSWVLRRSLRRRARMVSCLACSDQIANAWVSRSCLYILHMYHRNRRRILCHDFWIPTSSWIGVHAYV